MLSPKLSVLDESVGGRADLRMVDSSKIGWLVGVVTAMVSVNY